MQKRTSIRRLVGKDRLLFGLLTVCYLVTWLLTYRLFLRQAIEFYPGTMGTYVSDLPAHIREGVAGTGYSLMELLYGLLLGKLQFSLKPVAAVLAFTVVGNIWVTYLLMRKLVPDCSKTMLHLFAFGASFVLSVHIRSLNGMRYLGVQSGSNWHNDTYTAMRFAAMLVLLFFYEWNNRYRERFSVSEFVLFTVLLVLVNWIKPNFIVAFAPAMLVVLVGDFFADRGKTVKRQILIGIPVLLSLAVLYLQVTELFSDPAESIESGFPLGLSFAYILRLRAQHPLASLLQSAAYPLIVFLWNFRAVKRDRFLQVTGLTWVTGLLEYLFIHEEGHRKGDGNLSWGYSFCIYLMFTVTSALYVQNITAFSAAYRQSGVPSFWTWAWNKETGNRRTLLYLLCAAVLYALHLANGLIFFGAILQGAHYAIG